MNLDLRHLTTYLVMAENSNSLRKQYDKVMKEAHSFSHKDRKKSDLKYAEAEQIMDKIVALQKKEN